MLNYLWLALIVIGILVALWGDFHDSDTNRFHNGEEIMVSLRLLDPTIARVMPGLTAACTIIIDPGELAARYRTQSAEPVIQKAELTAASDRSGAVRITVDEHTPGVWKEIFHAQKNREYLLAHVRFLEAPPAETFQAVLSFEPVKFVHMTTVTNDGIIASAKTAVELAIGLIGIMALWLGVMKIAEESGLVAKLSRALRPVMTRLFPDVPADHPAMGAMVMNISANILGLSNAATPLGLKAMEELNKLNTKLGTATDAMCTFLVINTSNLQLIPATVIAIRAASGSANPTEILGPVIVATAVAMTVGVTTVKLLAKLPVFRRQLLLQEKKGLPGTP